MDKRHLFIVIGMIYLLVAVYLGLNGTITGYVIYEDKSYDFDFLNQSNFIFDNDLIAIDNGEVSLVPYYNITNRTNIETLNSYINYAEYQQGESENSLEDVTSKLKSQGGEWVNFRMGHKFNVIFDRNLSNNDVVRFYLKGDNENKIVRLYICDYNTTCDSNYGIINYTFIPGNTSNGTWANLTLENLLNSKSNFSLSLENNASSDLRVDYIDSLYSANITVANTTIYYLSNGSLETNDLIIDGLFKYYYINSSGNINVYYSIDSGGNWNLTDGNLSDVNSSKIRFKFDLFSDGVSSPVIYDFDVRYYGIMQENQSNATESQQPSSGSSGGGGGGGGGGGSSSENEVIITPTNNTAQTTSSNKNELNSVIGGTNEETVKGSSNVLGNQSVEPAKKSENLALLTGRAVLNDIRNNWGLFIILGLIVLYYIYLTYKKKKKNKRK